MNLKRVICLTLTAALALSGCSKLGTGKNGDAVVLDGDSEAVELMPTVPPPTPTEPPNEKDIAYAKWIQTVLYMAPHSEVDGLFVHMDPESMEYLTGIVGERVELTAEPVDKNLFYKYIAFTLGVSSFTELADKIDSQRSTGKIYFTLTYPFDDPRRTIEVEFDGTSTKIY